VNMNVVILYTEDRCYSTRRGVNEKKRAND